MDKMLFKGEEVVLVNVLTDGRDADAQLYAVPTEWATLNNIKQYDWSEQDNVPEEILAQIFDFPKVDITRIWTY